MARSTSVLVTVAGLLVPGGLLVLSGIASCGGGDEGLFAPGASGSTAGAGSGGEAGACEAVVAAPKKAGVDIVFIVDNSHSMVDEIRKVEANLATFSNIINLSKVDHQVIMLSAKGTNKTDFTEDVPNLKGSGMTGDMPVEVCVPPPLGVGPAGNCGDRDPTFHHLDHWPFGIASHNGMWLAIGMYQKEYTWTDDPADGPEGGGWAKWARPEAVKFFVMVTDDDAEVPDHTFGEGGVPGEEPYQAFDRLILNDDRFVPRGMFGTAKNRRYVYNAICGWSYPGGRTMPADEGGGCLSEPGVTENFAMSPGQQHQKLAKLTGGVVDSICKTDWSAILANLANAVVQRIGCEYVIPPAQDGEIDPDFVVVQYTPEGGEKQELDRVTEVSGCTEHPNAWYYDNNEAPTSVHLCPGSCSTIVQSTTGRVDVAIGCRAPSPVDVPG